jgi:hypothetical protein
VDRKVTVQLKRPTVEALLEIQEAAAKAGPGSSARDGYKAALVYVASVMKDPKMSPEELCDEVDGWSMRDWNALQDATMELTGMKEEAQAMLAAAFPGAE